MSEPVPIKCKPETAVGVEDNPCSVPGKKPRCVLCPLSPTYWRHNEVTK